MIQGLKSCAWMIQDDDGLVLRMVLGAQNKMLCSTQLSQTYKNESDRVFSLSWNTLTTHLDFGNHLIKFIGQIMFRISELLWCVIF